MAGSVSVQQVNLGHVRCHNQRKAESWCIALHRFIHKNVSAAATSES